MRSKTFVVFALILLAVITPITAKNRRDRERKKEKDKPTVLRPVHNNICTMEGDSQALHCFCNSVHIANATSVQCMIFSSPPKDHTLWNLFSSQPYVADLKLTGRQGGQFDFIPTKGITYLRDLQSLEVKYGNISDVHSFAFANLTQLRKLTLIRNHIINLNMYAFAHLPNLTEVNLDENRINELHRDVFVNLPSIQKLYMAQNNLSLLHDGAFRHLSSLLELDLDQNYLIVITRDTFNGLSGLKRLILTNNRIDMLGDLTFAELWMLEELLLSSNRIEFISDRAFAGLTHLKQLVLSYNQLKLLSGGILDGIPAITHLDLRNNSLQTLTFDNVRPFLHNLYNETSYLYLENNKFVCDCRLSWMHSLKNETKNELIRNSLEEVVCYLEGAEFQVTAAPVATNPKTIDGSLMNAEEDVYEDKMDGLPTDEDDDGYVYEEPENDIGRATRLRVQPQEHHDPAKKRFFQIPMEKLPCPQKMHGPTEISQLSNNIENTPGYAESSISGSVKIVNCIWSSIWILMLSVAFWT